MRGCPEREHRANTRGFAEWECVADLVDITDQNDSASGTVEERRQEFGVDAREVLFEYDQNYDFEDPAADELRDQNTAVKRSEVILQA